MSGPRPERCEVLVLGGDVEALVAALVAARRGRRVVVLCERARPGGLHGASEFHPGFATRGAVHDEDRLDREVADELDLARHGLAFEDAPPMVAVGGDGRTVTARATADDAHRAVLAGVLRDAPPDLAPDGLGDALDLSRRAAPWRALGDDALHELTWRLPASIADFVEPRVDDPLERALVAADALPGTWVGPRAAGTTAIHMLRDAARGAAPRRPVGGGPALVRALLAALREHGARVHCGEPIGRVATTGRGPRARVRGAWLADGREYRADLVLSTLDPLRTLRRLVPDEALDDDARFDLASLRARGTIAVLDLAFDAPLAARVSAGPVAYLDDADEMERAADDVKHGRVAARPWLVAHEHACDAGRAWTVHVHGVPHDAGDDARATVVDRAFERLRAAHADFDARLVARRDRLPVDLARAHGSTGGHLWQAELALDQLHLLRPTVDLARYAAPVEGLWMGGSAQHPGGVALGRAGFLAAGRALASR